MHNFSETKILQYSVKELYDIVLDVEAYPSFLPWVENTQIISKNDNVIVADMTVNFKSIRQNYRSNVKCEYSHSKAMIEVNAIPGIFKHLYNLWRFTEGKDGTIVEFIVDFQFQSKLLDVIVSPLFEAISKKMILAFETQAMEKYGRSKDK